MALIELQQALCDAGLDAEITEITGAHVVFSYVIPAGDHVGEAVRVALTGPDFPVNPPGGVHVSPPIQHPGGNNHASPLGEGWLYWSRPYPDWASSTRDVDDYLAFLRQLFAQFAANAA